MTEHGWEKNEWPQISEKVMAADILIIGSSIWLGEKTSVCTKIVERLYATSHLLNKHGQYAYYGRVGGCLITGNEDGAKFVIYRPEALDRHTVLFHDGYGNIN